MAEKGPVTLAVLTELLDPLQGMEESQKGEAYQSILRLVQGESTIEDDAKTRLCGFLLLQMRSLIDALKAGKDNEEMDKAISLELLVDIADAVANNALLELVKESLTVANNSIRFYALQTLFNHSVEAEPKVIAEMARDAVQAANLFDLLAEHHKTGLFPQELKNQEYLAQSDMVHWLTYPTELGDVPEEIECLGTVKKRKEIYYVFRFRHRDFDGNEWLIGWSGGYNRKELTGGGNGGTFSYFEKQKDIEAQGKSLLKTMRKILF